MELAKPGPVDINTPESTILQRNPIGD